MIRYRFTSSGMSVQRNHAPCIQKHTKHIFAKVVHNQLILNLHLPWRSVCSSFRRCYRRYIPWTNRVLRLSSRLLQIRLCTHAPLDVCRVTHASSTNNQDCRRRGIVETKLTPSPAICTITFSASYQQEITMVKAVEQ